MEHRQIIRTIAQRFVERAESLGYKGKKRDDAALDYWCGAAVAAEASGDANLGQRLANIAVLIVAVRGYFGVKEMAADEAPLRKQA